MKESMGSISILITVELSNVQGCASDKFLWAFWEYNNQYKPDIISLLEPSVSGGKADMIITKLGWDNSHRVEAVGFFRGI
ncbi:hypothetical protein J1N35_018672 [Gossypium stocksii]|uniref:Uncharacterized protein n=1 Tax=Gossypium stocksii TaxID=47602 RepID=A0A9D3VRG6_9ROSI|nr:hypothetical protein J1N35_018672 [Gossypium stocksii]